MNKKIAVRFENALDIAVERVKHFGAGLGREIVLVRDLRGRIRVLVPESSKALSPARKKAVDDLVGGLAESLGAYGFPPDRMILFADDLMQGKDAFVSSDRRLITEENGLKIWLLDRQITGQDWMRSPLQRETQTPWVTFFGIKGGVGRSTALAVWAWRLAGLGKKILILDLDLESPGVSSTLLPFEFLPDYGIVDWFVEDGVGQAETVENLMIAASPLAGDLPGDIRIVPAFGRDTGDYLPKLARCYAESNAGEHMEWAERLQKMAHRVEQQEAPDIVILDSRAGLHDISAATITRMGAYTFMFAVDSMQTWNAYTFLFKHWRLHPRVTQFRQQL